ncbi:hypothetical protein ACU4GR_00690 [Methylobacterium oryzae CBMB20]
MWEQVFADLAPGFVPEAAALDRAAEALGFALPDSYHAFCRTCGVGLAGDSSASLCRRRTRPAIW